MRVLRQRTAVPGRTRRLLGISPSCPLAAPPPTRAEPASAPCSTLEHPPSFPGCSTPFPCTARPLRALLLAVCAATQRLETMTRLQLSLAIGDYDRTRPLLDGGV